MSRLWNGLGVLTLLVVVGKAPAAPGATIQGTIQMVAPTGVNVLCQGTLWPLLVQPTTQITLNGQPIPFAKLRPGFRVVVTVVRAPGGQLTTTNIVAFFP
jgi:hypothetical protein